MILYMLFSSYSQPVTFIEFWLYPNKLHYHNLGGGIGGNCNNSGDHMRDELVVCLVLRIATITTPPLLLHFHPPLHVASLVVVAQHTTCILALGMIPECWQRGYRAPNILCCRPNSVACPNIKAYVQVAPMINFFLVIVTIWHLALTCK